MKLTKKNIAVFNASKHLLCVCPSAYRAASAFGLSTQNIHYACTGRVIASAGYYFRYVIEPIDMTAPRILSLTEYDKLCGVSRRVYKNKTMSRATLNIKRHTKRKRVRADNNTLDALYIAGVLWNPTKE